MAAKLNIIVTLKKLGDISTNNVKMFPNCKGFLLHIFYFRMSSIFFYSRLS